MNCEYFTHVIIGNGPAGIYAAEILRKVSDESILIVTSESYDSYSRCILPEILVDKKEDLKLRDNSWCKNYRINQYINTEVKNIDTGKKIIETQEKQIGYDKLLIATGANPIFIPIKGVKSKGVYGIRTLKDINQVIQDLSSISNVAIIGGGFIGIKAAESLSELGKNVYIIEKLPQILGKVLDNNAAEILKRILIEHDISILTGKGLVEIIEDNGQAKGIVLDDGSVKAAELIILSMGVKPAIDFIKNTPIETLGGRGILVDDYMRTNVADVYAAGDVTIAKNLLTGSMENIPIWPVATEQARIAALNMAGYEIKYEGGFARNSVRVFGLPIQTAGITIKEHDDIEEVEECDLDNNVYIKNILSQEGILKGYISIGSLKNVGKKLSYIKKRMVWKKK